MNIKIYEKSLNIGKNDYIDLHLNISEIKNLKQIKELFTNFNLENEINKNTYFQGITIYDDYNYIITNKLNNKKYIGETCNLIARMYAYYNLNISNKQLKEDVINFGVKNFDIEIIKTNNRKVNEKILIDNYIKNCYNINFTDKKLNFKRKKEYNIGNFKFKTKKEIKNYCRKILDKYNPGTELELNSSDGIFACEMIKLHPKYDGFLDKSDNIKLLVVKDNQSDAYGIGKWNIFNFKYKHIHTKIDTDWGFSTNKIIDNL